MLASSTVLMTPPVPTAQPCWASAKATGGEVLRCTRGLGEPVLAAIARVQDRAGVSHRPTAVDVDECDACEIVRSVRRLWGPVGTPVSCVDHRPGQAHSPAVHGVSRSDREQPVRRARGLWGPMSTTIGGADDGAARTYGPPVSSVRKVDRVQIRLWALLCPQSGAKSAYRCEQEHHQSYCAEDIDPV